MERPKKRKPAVEIIIICWIALLVTILLVALSGCKSLEQKCSEKYPPSINVRTSFIRKDTVIPPSLKSTSIPCPEMAAQLPKDGKKVILAEDDNIRITGSAGKNGQLVIDAMTKGKVIHNTTTEKITDSARVICNCDEQIELSHKAGVVDCMLYLFGLVCLVCVIYWIAYYLRLRKHEKDRS